MCIIAAKYFSNTGWVLAKNRDQDYVSEVTFKDEIHPKVGEVFTLYDHDTDYQEGMNYKGLTIITTSLTPTLYGETNKKDGENIRKALNMTSPEEAANFLVKQKMTGYIFCATPTKLVLVEAAKKDNGKGAYESIIRVVPKTETVVRTNHGVDLPWAGFQSGVNDQQDIWAKSSEMRKRQAEFAVKNSKSAEEMLEAMSRRMTKDLQFNQFRVENKPRQMRTIFQWALVPSKHIVYLRPIQCKMQIDVTKEKIRIEVMDNEPIKKIYGERIKHFSKIKSLDNGKIIKTVQTEEFKSFKEYIG